MALYRKKLSDIAALLNAGVHSGKNGNTDATVYRIEYDSRKACEGDIFVCLKGAVSDGHKFAPMAYAGGCRAFLCEDMPSLPDDAVVLTVSDTRAALAQLSAYFYDYPADKLRIIGITGTKGKTTTALMVSAILNKCGKNCAYIGSNGVIINGKRTETLNTTPESRELHHYFAMMVENGVKYAAIEVSSQALAHNRVDGIPFAVKAFLNLTPDHIGGAEHKDFDDYKAAKASFFTDYDGDIVYNADDPESLSVISSCKESARHITFGMSDGVCFGGIGGTLYRDSRTLGIDFTCIADGVHTPVRLRSPGAFSIYNALAAIACTKQLGVSVSLSADALSGVSVMGRFEIIPGLAERTFIIDYAHNGESMRRALTALREYSPRRLIVVFGSVGGRTQGRRRELAESASALADLSIITSDNPDNEPPREICDDIVSHIREGHPYTVITDREDAVREAVRMSRPGDIVFFAGKGHETYQLIRGQKLPFVEADIIRDECTLVSAEG